MSPDLTEALFDAIAEHRDRPAITGYVAAPGFRTRAVTWTYGALGDRIERFSGGLRAAGFASGDRVLFSIRPNPDGVALVFAVIAAGGSIAFIDPGMGPELFATRVGLVAPRWTATESLLYALGLPGPGRLVGRRTGLTLPRFADLPARHLYYGDWLPGVPRGARSVRSLPGTPAAPEQTAPDHEALIVFTSGTTGDPRAVVHTRGSLGAGMSTAAASFTSHDDLVLHTDQLMTGLPALLAGGHWRIPRFRLAARLDPARIAAELHGATDTFMVPADLPVLLQAIDSGAVRLPTSLRRIVVGGAPVPPALVRRTAATLPQVELSAIYGMTEMIPVAITDAATKLAHTGSGDPLGRPCAGVSTRIAADGELMVSGPALCTGYLGQQPLSEHATGDLARLEPDGTIVLIGRKKDMILRGKTNIYPGLYEPAIGKIAGVAEAVLIGLSDEFGREEVALALTNDTPQHLSDAALVATVRAELPQRVDLSALPDHIVVVPSIPRQGRSRKPDRAALAQHVRTLVG